MSHKLGKKKIVDTLWKMEAVMSLNGSLRLVNPSKPTVNLRNTKELDKFWTNYRGWVNSLNTHEFGYLVSKEFNLGRGFAGIQLKTPNPITGDGVTWWTTIHRWKGHLIVKAISNDLGKPIVHTFFFHRGICIAM